MTLRFIKFFVLTGLIANLTACISQPPQEQGYLINAKAPKAMSCQQLEQKIAQLEAAPKTETFNNNPNISTPFAFKNQYTDQLKKLKRSAAIKGCYDRPAYIAPAPVAAPAPTATPPKLIDTQRQQLSFDQCFNKCKELTQRSNEQCFDSCK